MIVQHNITAMNANRMLGLTTGSLAKSSEKLSSGYRINRAADDAAGLSISEKMRKQIRGLSQASTNAEDGISAVQTAEGALTEVHSMLQRMNELAVQAANGTLEEEDRQSIQDEIDNLVTEIDRVSETTKFNELYLLKGNGSEMVTKTKNATPMTAKYDIDTDTVVIKKKASQITPANWYLEGATAALAGDNAIIENLMVDEDGNVTTKDGVALYKAAAVDGTEFGSQTEAQKVSDADIQIIYGASSTVLYSDSGCTAAVAEEDLKNYFNEDGTVKSQLYAKNTAGTATAVGAEQIDKFVKVTPAADEEEYQEEQMKALTFSLHVGSESSDPHNKITVTIDSMSAKGIGIDGLSGTGLMTQADATDAIDTIGAAIKKVSSQRSALGAIQNRLEHTIVNLDNVVENTTAAESRIRDTDMAEEMVTYSKNSILQQAGQSMLAQANQANQGVLSLLQ